MTLFSFGIYIYVRSGLMNQIDNELQRDASAIAVFLHKEGDNIHELHETEELKSAPIFMVFKDGQRIFATGSWRESGLNKPPVPAQPDSDKFMRDTANGAVYRLNYLRQKIRKSDYIIITAHTAGEMLNSLQTLVLALTIGMPFLLLAAGLGGWFMAGRVLAPVAALAATAREITADSLDRRLPVVNPDDEFGALATVFNETLARLSNSFDLLRRFTSDASHELRTPLTALRSVGEVGLHAETDQAACRDIIGSMLEEADRLALLVDNLLTLTRLDTGNTEEQSEYIQLSELLQDITRCLCVLAEEKNQEITVDTDDPIMMKGNAQAIRQAVTNLLDNAIKYTPENGRIYLSASRNRCGQSVIKIADTGPGISPEHQHRIFERFYRIDSDRSSSTGGSGLGLAIARQAVERNGGEIKMESVAGGGAEFSIIFPAIQKGGCPESENES
jgi:heavy metal sensor kinase